MVSRKEKGRRYPQFFHSRRRGGSCLKKEEEEGREKLVLLSLLFSSSHLSTFLSLPFFLSLLFLALDDLIDIVEDLCLFIMNSKLISIEGPRQIIAIFFYIDLHSDFYRTYLIDNSCHIRFKFIGFLIYLLSHSNLIYSGYRALLSMQLRPSSLIIFPPQSYTFIISLSHSIWLWV